MLKLSCLVKGFGPSGHQAEHHINLLHCFSYANQAQEARTD